jgi:hypothetical protein
VRVSSTAGQAHWRRSRKGVEWGRGFTDVTLLDVSIISCKCGSYFNNNDSMSRVLQTVIYAETWYHHYATRVSLLSVNSRTKRICRRSSTRYWVPRGLSNFLHVCVTLLTAASFFISFYLAVCHKAYSELASHCHKGPFLI